ncbi:alpha/beta hydrolase [Aggregicoccus sp. 17bor-14]|uniref:alpha/beta hydrolase n=1 Tax=Myxococcaceae TaxID=31 RepID=UPI00129CDA15|nr:MULTISPECIES: alpha/beta fold hydrolase [Myxococcaceae]MBF5046416.1 alpha/beta fold hydrolase [Simulacricoccus sp. 17bor-14]MRI92135.1 alpha/beta hydrolase [Aggregicoccus sp. 17bor-14]
MTPSAFDLSLPRGPLHAHRYGVAGAPLVLCVPGLSANALSFGAIAPRLAARGLQVVALDLRGRGQSPSGAPGSHGWPNHAQDVLDAASALGAERFGLIGHSMGAFVSLALLSLDAARVSRVALIDALGPPEAAALGPIGDGLRRLGLTFPSEDAYVAAVRDAGVVAPWNEVWERHYRYELTRAPEGGVRARTDMAVVKEDLEYGKAHDARSHWGSLRKETPALVLRAAQGMGPGGFVIRAEDYERFGREVPHARRVDVEANHFGVMTHEGSLAALEALFAP